MRYYIQILTHPVFYVKRVRYIDDTPITIEDTWMPVALFPDLTYQVMQNSKYDYIENQKKMVIDRSEQELTPILPSQEIADLLQLETTQSIIEKRTRSFLQSGVVFEYSCNYFTYKDYKFTLVAKRHR